MMALLLSSGRYSAEEIGESKGVFCTLLCFAGWSVHEDTNGYEAIHLLCSGRSSMEEICELNTAFCKLLGFFWLVPPRGHQWIRNKCICWAMVHTTQKKLVNWRLSSANSQVSLEFICVAHSEFSFSMVQQWWHASADPSNRGVCVHKEAYWWCCSTSLLWEESYSYVER